MDPQTLLDQILAAMRQPLVLSDEERNELAEQLYTLADWIDQGGFIPRP